VGSFAPNAFGLFDMHGNVAEWCADQGYFNLGGLPWSGTGARAIYADEDGRIVRGGSACSPPSELRCSALKLQTSTTRHGWTGFRPARAVAG
jgi:formylglycine-generating enzyme required for sulfatase activity